jgi:hypothetical protein
MNKKSCEIHQRTREWGEAQFEKEIASPKLLHKVALEDVIHIA